MNHRLIALGLAAAIACPVLARAQQAERPRVVDDKPKAASETPP